MGKYSEYFTYIKAKYMKIGSVQISEFSTDGTMAGNSDVAIPTEQAVKTYVDAKAGSIDAMVYKGTIACSGNPNYPAADAGHFYIVSSAGKIGGGSGIAVQVGDAILCNTDATTSGTEAQKGAYWNIMQTNIADPSAYATLASPTFTGTPSMPTGTTAVTQAVDNNSTALATTAFVLAQAGSANPIMDGAAAAGSSKRYAPIDHVHPSDTTKAASGHNHSATYLGLHAKADDSALLGGAASGAFSLSGHTHSGTYIPVPTTGTAAPSSTPSAIGLYFLDTTGKKAYVSMGTGASSDWIILN
jgi:hypothetical protein